VASNLADKFEEMADAVPRRLVLAAGDERVTFGDLEARANRLAHHLAGHGVGPGACVGLAARNSVPFVVSFLACFKLRAVPVNVNYRYTGAEMREILDDSEAAAVVLDGDLAGECALAVADLADPCGRADPPRRADPPHLVVIGGDTGPLGDRAVTYNGALASSSPARDFAPRSADDIHMLYTGGTTGRPKGVVWRHEDMYLFLTFGAGTDAALATARDNPDAAPVVMLPAGPFVHSSSQWMLIAALISGSSTIVVVDRFDPAAVWAACRREGVQVLAINGDAMARPLLDALAPGRPGLDRLTTVYSSGGLLSPAVKAELARALPQAGVLDSIGATETGLLGMSPATAEPGPPGLRITGTPGTIVVDDTGRPVPPGGTGLLAKCGYIPLRYHHDPEKTARTFITHEGTRYAIPGDVARVEPDGTITVLGRESACINTGGEKVYPGEVEGVLNAHPGVQDCLVVGVPDDRWGQRVCALVQARAGQTVTLDELQAHARGALAGYKLPRTLRLVERIERHPSGKVDYRWAARVLAGESPDPTGGPGDPVPGAGERGVSAAGRGAGPR
jgi:acyl-CoA synthetase (AMP-forming)/AMP-acid ligase II